MRYCILLAGFSLMASWGPLPPRAYDLVDLDRKIKRGETTEVHLGSPPDSSPSPVAALPFEVEGYFTLAAEHRLLSKPKVSVLVGKGTSDQARAEVGEQREDGEVPFHAKLKCPKGTREVELRATFVVARKDDTKTPPRQIVIEAKPLRVAVEAVGAKP